jgi:integrase/recombinase XerD
MSGLNQAVEDYLTTRRALGFKLERHGRLLPHLVGYLERAGAATVTTELALAWATQSEGHPDESAKRLSVARGFAATCRPWTQTPRCQPPICSHANSAEPAPICIPMLTLSP